MNFLLTYLLGLLTIPVVLLAMVMYDWCYFTTAYVAFLSRAYQRHHGKRPGIGYMLRAWSRTFRGIGERRNSVCFPTTGGAVTWYHRGDWGRVEAVEVVAGTDAG